MDREGKKSAMLVFSWAVIGRESGDVTKGL